MNEENAKKKPALKVVSLCIKITKEASQWLKDKDYSPTGLFNEGMKDLGYKGE
jgi:hypothetical protein